MAGGLLQLVSYGVQDVFLVGNPTITYFKLVYKRHTNFACEDIIQTATGGVGPGKKATWTISRNGDLLSKAVLEMSFPPLERTHIYVDQPALAAIEKVTLEIGGQTIDRLYPEFMDVRNELFTPASQKSGLSAMLGETAGGRQDAFKAIVDLPFFFGTNYGAALPLIALQYHEVKISVDFAPVEKFTRKLSTESNITSAAKAGLTAAEGTWGLPGRIACERSDLNTGDMNDFKCEMYCTYVFLDSAERKRTASTSASMLITQCQFAGESSAHDKGSSAFATVSKTIRLAFNHPTKELLIVSKPKQAFLDNTCFAFSNYTASTDAPLNPKAMRDLGGSDKGFDNDRQMDRDTIKEIVLLINGNERQTHMPGQYYSTLTPYRHHTAVPNKLIHVMPFSLFPESHQPSGSLNFSRLDNAELRFVFDGNLEKYANRTISKAEAKSAAVANLPYERDIHVYAVSYNILKVQSGMAGLAYSN